MPLERRRSSLSRLDDLVLVGLAVVAVVGVLTVIGWVVSTIAFLVKVAVAAVVFGLVFRYVAGRR